MNLRRAMVLVACVALLGVAAFQRSQANRLRAENAGLKQSAAEAEQLRAEAGPTNSSSDREVADEIARLREENRGLLKLRNEIGQLRAQKPALDKPAGGNARAPVQPGAAPGTGVPLPISITPETISDLGRSTPEAALQTFFWAWREGNTEALANCFVPSRLRRGQLPEAEQLRRMFVEKFNSKSMQIVARRTVEPGLVELGVQISEGDWNDKIIVPLRLTGSEWKLDLDVSRLF